MPPTALITGASSGMGLEYARQLAEIGTNLLIVSNQQKELEQCTEELRTRFGVQVWSYYCNLARFEAADELLRFCDENQLDINILINNAGMFFFQELQGEVCAKADTMMYLHVITPTRLCALFGNRMKQRGEGHILNVSSIAAGMTVPGLTLYAATKSYLKSFSKSLYYEMEPYGVHVTTVCPGAVATGLYSVLPTLTKVLNFGAKLGVVYSPQKLVRKALKAMFRCRRCVTPGWFNLLFAPIVQALPKWGVRKIWKAVR